LNAQYGTFHVTNLAPEILKCFIGLRKTCAALFYSLGPKEYFELNGAVSMVTKLRVGRRRILGLILGKDEEITTSPKCPEVF
jgi:hypothetical protein